MDAIAEGYDGHVYDINHEARGWHITSAILFTVSTLTTIGSP